MTLNALWTTLFYAWIISEVVIAIATRTPASAGNVQDRGTQLMLWIVVFSSVTAAEIIRHTMEPNLLGDASWLKIAGVVLLLAGLAVRWIAILTLGKSFSANVAIKSSQTIQRTGIYRFVRHPSYLGMLLVFLAIGVFSRNWFGLAAAMLPTTAALLYRIRIEEAVLNKTFGAEYAAYSKATKRLVPGLF